MLKVAILGAGYVGLTTACCLSDLGHQVVCIDSNAAKIQALKRKIVDFYEPGLQDLLEKNWSRLSFAHEYENLQNIDVLICTIGTPSLDSSGKSDISGIFQAFDAVSDLLPSQITIILKSTIPLGVSRQLYEKIAMPGRQFYFQPEFLSEGRAVNDFFMPSRVVLGCFDGEMCDLDFIQRLYPFLKNNQIPVQITDYESAELIKYTSNGLLAAKVAFINEVANLCAVAGGNFEDVAEGVGADPRIGSAFLKPGPGFGGSCFPKDLRALSSFYRDAGLPGILSESILESNKAHQVYLAQKIIDTMAREYLENPTIAVLGVTFKAETDDVRESPSLTILPLLQRQGINLKVYDPYGMEKVKAYFPEAEFLSCASDAIKGSHALLILTEWSEFSNLDLRQIRDEMPHLSVFDFRNILDVQVLKKLQIPSVRMGEILT